MRLCLVDDDSTQLNFLKSIIDKWSSLNNVSVEVSFYHSAEEMLFENDKLYPFDMIFLDIQMDKMNGIELAKRIREKDRKVIIVFVSGIADYVFEGYIVQAIRYILKPVEEKNIFDLLDFVIKNQNKEDKYIIINSSGEKKKILHDEIIFIESLGHYVVFHLEKETIDCKYNISSMLVELNNTDFVKTHRSYIVNLNHIDKINKDSCLMSNQIEVPLSRSAYRNVNEKFIEYYREKN